MKRLSLLLSCMVFALVSLSAQNVSKKYISFSSQEGKIFFIKPLKGYKSKELKTDLEYDMTYTTMADSIAYNFTFIEKADKPDPVTSVSFSSSGETFTFPAEMLYVKAHKKDKWIYRVSVRMPYASAKEIYKQDTPYILEIHRTNDSSFEIKAGEWKKQSEIVNKIFQIIDLTT